MEAATDSKVGVGEEDEEVGDTGGRADEDAADGGATICVEGDAVVLACTGDIT